MNNLNTPRKIKALETKERILNAALKIIKKHGYEYLTVRNICDEAKVSTGSFYHHFANKDEVLFYFIIEGYNKYKKKHEDSSSNDKGIRTTLLDIYGVYDDYCIENGVEFLSEYYNTKNQCMNTDNNSLSKEYVNNSLYGRTILEIKKAQENGYMKIDLSTKQIADDLCTINKGAVFEWCLCKGSFDLTATALRLMGIYIDSQLTKKYWDDFTHK